MSKTDQPLLHLADFIKTWKKQQLSMHIGCQSWFSRFDHWKLVYKNSSVNNSTSGRLLLRRDQQPCRLGGTMFQSGTAHNVSRIRQIVNLPGGLTIHLISYTSTARLGCKEQSTSAIRGFKSFFFLAATRAASIVTGMNVRPVSTIQQTRVESLVYIAAAPPMVQAQSSTSQLRVRGWVV